MKSILIILLIMIPFASFGQERDTITFNGIVVDMKGEPIINAVVTLNNDTGTVAGQLTDFDGKFTINIIGKEDYKLIVKFIGFIEQHVILNKSYLEPENDVTVKLRPANNCTPITITTICVPHPMLQKHSGTNKTFSGEDFDRMAH